MVEKTQEGTIWRYYAASYTGANKVLLDKFRKACSGEKIGHNRPKTKRGQYYGH